MTADEILVLVTGAVLVAGINWWFVIAPGRRSSVVAAVSAGGLQEVTVTVHGGYTPDPIEVEAGRPVRLHFHRTETGSCSEEVVLADFGVRVFLPPHEVTPVEFLPARPGRYRYTCGMGMLQGTVIVTSPRHTSRSRSLE